MKTLIENYDRIELFNHYNNKDNPFVIVTTKIDITNIYNKCKHYYASIAYYLTCAINKVDGFKVRFEDNNFYLYDKLNVNFTQKYQGLDKIGFFTVPFKDNYNEFIDDYLDIQETFNKEHTCIYNNDLGEVWFSYVPWFNASGIVPPFDKDVHIPQFIWDKFIFENDKVFVNLTIMVHHGFVDGSHIGEVLNNFNNIVNNL